MASATRVDGIVAFANAGENLQPAATAAVEARPQGNAEAKPALAADRCACWAPALSIEPWMSPGRVARRVVAVAVALAGRVAGAVVRTRGGAGEVGGASTATGAGIAAGGRLADQGADGAICWRSIDGWLLGCPITDVAPGAARKLRSLINATARVQCLNQCVAASSGQPRWPGEQPSELLGSTGRSRTQCSKAPSEASEACREGLRSNEHACGASFLTRTRSCLSYSS